MTKWLSDVAPDEPVAAVAVRAVGARLGAVRRHLRRAARAGDLVDVHQLRVWSRRADAALSLYAEVFPRRRLRRMRRWLRRIRRAAGQVRDCDVFARWVTDPDGPWPVRLRAERRQGMKTIRRLAAKLDDGRRLKRRARALLARAGRNRPWTAEPFGRWAPAGLRPLVAAFLDNLPGPAADDAALHRLRIQGKRLRYAMELLAGAFPPVFRDELYPQVGALQERLGTVNDLASACMRLDEWLAGAGSPTTVSRLRRRRADAEEQLLQARAAFHRWWTAGFVADLRARLAELGGRPPPE